MKYAEVGIEIFRSFEKLKYSNCHSRCIDAICLRRLLRCIASQSSIRYPFKPSSEQITQVQQSPLSNEVNNKIIIDSLTSGQHDERKWKYKRFQYCAFSQAVSYANHISKFFLFFLLCWSKRSEYSSSNDAQNTIIMQQQRILAPASGHERVEGR